MTIVTEASPDRAPATNRGGFRGALAAEWVKFRTVRGWLVALVVAVVLCAIFTLLVANGNHTGTCTGNGVCTSGHAFVPTGPSGEAVADSYQYLDRPLSGNGTFTAQVTSLSGLISTRPADAAPSITASRPGLAAWAKAGILLTASTAQGSPCAAVMATGAHGVRFQYDYTHDQAGLPGQVTEASPRWLRLTRSGDTITAYDSTDGATWHQIGGTRLAGLPATVEVGLFVTSPLDYHDGLGGAPTQATAHFSHLTLDGHPVTGGWQSHTVGATDYYPKLGSGSAQVTGQGAVISGSGDIAPAVNISALGGNSAAKTILFGLVVALILLIVVATMFITIEYRRGLIRTTFTAMPQRGSVLAAKAIVIGAAAFAVGAIAAAIAVPLGIHALGSGGNYVFPDNAATLTQVIVGAGVLLAITAIGVLGLGTILRSSAGAIAVGMVIFLLPNLLGPGGGGSGGSDAATAWLYRFTPAAAFSVFGTLPRSGLVDFPYTLGNGYYPLAPWAGLVVLCVYAAVTMAGAAFLLRRRDA